MSNIRLLTGALVAIIVAGVPIHAAASPNLSKGIGIDYGPVINEADWSLFEFVKSMRQAQRQDLMPFATPTLGESILVAQDAPADDPTESLRKIEDSMVPTEPEEAGDADEANSGTEEAEAEAADASGDAAPDAATETKPKPALDVPPAPAATAEEPAQKGTCKVDDDCKGKLLCQSGRCISPRDISEEESEGRDADLNLDEGHWAHWGGYIGLGLTLGVFALSVSLPGEDATTQTATYFGYMLIPILTTISGNSAQDNVGVRGAPGQEFGAWMFFATHVLVGGLGYLPYLLGSGNNGTVLLFNMFGFVSSGLMFSASLRAARQVRRAKRRAENAQEGLEVGFAPIGHEGRPVGLMPVLQYRF